MGEEGLEPSMPEGDGFTVRCDANFATPPGVLVQRLKGFQPLTVAGYGRGINYSDGPPRPSFGINN